MPGSTIVNYETIAAERKVKDIKVLCGQATATSSLLLISLVTLASVSTIIFLASAYHFTDKIGAKKTLEGASRRKQFQKGKCISDTQLAAKTQTSDL